MAARREVMGRRQALSLALLALDDQARQPDTLPEFNEAGRILRRILRHEDSDPARREDLTVLRSNLGQLDPGI